MPYPTTLDVSESIALEEWVRGVGNHTNQEAILATYDGLGYVLYLTAGNPPGVGASAAPMSAHSKEEAADALKALREAHQRRLAGPAGGAAPAITVPPWLTAWLVQLILSLATGA